MKFWQIKQAIFFKDVGIPWILMTVASGKCDIPEKGMWIRCLHDAIPGWADDLQQELIINIMYLTHYPNQKQRKYNVSVPLCKDIVPKRKIEIKEINENNAGEVG